MVISRLLYVWIRQYSLLVQIHCHKRVSLSYRDKSDQYGLFIDSNIFLIKKKPSICYDNILEETNNQN